MADRSVVYRLRAEASQFQAQMKAAGASVKDAADKMTAADREGVKFRKGLDSLGSAAGKVGLVAAAGLGAAIVKAANFDQAMSNVSAATGETAANMDKLRQAALDAGASTAFSATEAADGIEQLAKAGVATTDILNGGLMGALDLAAAGEIAVGEAAEVAAKAMTQFGLSGEQVPHIADLLASAAGNASGEVSDFGMALSQAGLVANQVGLTIEETTGGLAAFASAGLLGSDAGTSLKAALGALTPNSDKAAKTMSQLGISAFDAQGNFIGLAEFAGNLRESLATMTDEQRQATLETIFGSDAVRAASVLYEQGEDGIRKWIDTVDDQGAAADMAGEKLNNLKGDLEALGGALETALIGTGDGSQGFLRGVTQGLTGAINKYNELPSAAQTATAAVLTGSAALGGSIWVGSKLVQGISNTRDALDNLGVSSEKSGRALKRLAVASSVVVGVELLAGAVVGLANALDESLPGSNALQGQLLDLADGRIKGLSEEFDTLGRSVERVTSPTSDDNLAKFFDAVTPGDGRTKGMREATAEIQALDAALAELVASAGPQAAVDAFTSLYESGLLTASQLRDLGDQLPQYKDALAGAANESKIAATATEQVGEAMAAAAPLTKEQAKALGDARDAATKTATSFFNLGDSLNDAEKSLGQWINEMADQAEALRNFRINAEKAAENGLRKGLIAALKEAGPEGALRMKQLANATDAEIAKANKAWQAGQREIRAYVDETAKVPANKSTKLTVDSGPAFSAIAVIRRALKDIPDESVTVRVTRTGAGAVSPGFGPQANAAGGYITGPGTATSDSIPAYLSNGEYVIKAAAVEKYGTHMFDRLNAMHFADGGSVERPRRGLALAPGGAETIRELNQFVREQQRLFEAQREATQGMVDAAQEQRDAAKSTMDAAIAQRDAAGAAAVSAFEVDLFAQSGNPWAAGAGGGPLANLATSIAGLEQRDALINQLSAQGLTGTVLSTLLAQGSNADISGMIARGEIGQLASSFAQYEGLLSSVSANAGNAAFGANVARLSEQFAESERQLTRANEIAERQERQLDRANRALERQAEEFADALNGVAAGARRDKKNRGK